MDFDCHVLVAVASRSDTPSLKRVVKVFTGKFLRSDTFLPSECHISEISVCLNGLLLSVDEVITCSKGTAVLPIVCCGDEFLTVVVAALVGEKAFIITIALPLTEVTLVCDGAFTNTG